MQTQTVDDSFLCSYGSGCGWVDDAVVVLRDRQQQGVEQAAEEHVQLKHSKNRQLDRVQNSRASFFAPLCKETPLLIK